MFNSHSFINTLFIFSLVYALAVQPTIRSIHNLFDEDLELIIADLDKDSEEEENKEEEIKDDKIELQLSSSEVQDCSIACQSLKTFENILYRNFDLEIPIPPPELI